MKRVRLRGYGLDYYIYLITDKLFMNVYRNGYRNFSIVGLGLKKREREIFNNKFLRINGLLNISIGRVCIAYRPEGYKKSVSAMEIVSEEEITLNNFKKMFKEFWYDKEEIERNKFGELI